MSRASASMTAFDLASTEVSCDKIITVGGLQAKCGDSTVCEFGDQVDVSGYVTLSANAPQIANFKVKWCLLGVGNTGMMCYTIAEETADFCSTVGLSTADGATCPYQGSYTMFSKGLKIPGEPRNLMSGMSVSFSLPVCVV